MLVFVSLGLVIDYEICLKYVKRLGLLKDIRVVLLIMSRIIVSQYLICVL